MIDENEDYVTKPKLTITVKTFSKYTDRKRVAAKQTNKRTQRNRKQQIYRHKNKKHTYKQTQKQTCSGQTHTSRLTKSEKLDLMFCCYLK